MGFYVEEEPGPTPVAVSYRRPRGSETVEYEAPHYRGSETVYEAPARSVSTLRVPRVVDEQRASYERIQTLIGAYSKKFSVSVRRAPQIESRKQSSERPPFLEESAFLESQVKGIRFPKTVTYFDYNGHPTQQPVVMKNESVCKGQQKYLLENATQLHTFREWMKKHGKPDDWIAQEYIESPGNAPCTFRVLVDCTGEILASHISYGFPRSMGMQKGSMGADPEDPPSLLQSRGSDFFLNARSIASNHMIVHGDDTTTGGRIVLDPLPTSHPYSSKEKNILCEHGLDEEQPLLPQELTRVASSVGSALGMKEGKVQELVLGIDFIQRAGTNEYYMLEANRRPSMVTLRDKLGSANSVKELDAWQWVIQGALQRVALRNAQ